MQLLSDILFVLLAAYLGWAAIFTAIFSLSAFLPVKQSVQSPAKNKILVLIPAYKEDGVIVGSAKAALTQDYPEHLFTICVIADRLQAHTLASLYKLPVQVVEVSFVQSTKSKAIRAALDAMPTDYQGVVILDADNVMQKDFLQKVNNRLTQGYQAIQGRRVAKNDNSSVAILDGLSEDVNNWIYCRGHFALGLSSRLAGSGMAFAYNVFKQTMSQVDAVGGFDKELEVRLTAQRIRIAYDPTAEVLDEKVSKKEVFYTQRKRWISAQFSMFARFFSLGMSNLLKGNFDNFNKVLQLALPPRLILPVALALLSIVGILLNWYPIFWMSALLLNAGGMLLAIPKSFWLSGKWTSLYRLPVAIWQTLRAVFHLKGANKKFIHTPHGEHVQ